MTKWKSWFLTIIMLTYGSLGYGDAESTWKQTYAQEGDCHIDFPVQPQMIQQSMKVSEAGHKLLYDIYLSPFQNRGVLLLLIATYPGAFSEGHENAGLEGLVKGIVSHHSDNQLVFSNFVEFMGRPAIDFLVQGGFNYFRGYALMVGNKLYLIAMEGKRGELDEQVFNRFMKSFKLLSP
jgi:hypothetical protein